MEHESTLQNRYRELRKKLLLAEESHDESFQHQAVVLRAFIDENSGKIELESELCLQICEDLNWEQSGRPGILNRADIALKQNVVDAKQPLTSAQIDKPLPVNTTASAAHRKRFNSFRDRIRRKDA